MSEISHIERLADGLSETKLRLAIEAIGKNAECLKRDGETSVWKISLGDRAVIVKQWRLSRPKRRLQALIRRTPAFRHWHGALWLEQASIPTARCLAIARGRDAHALCEWLVMECLPGKTVLEHLADKDLSPRQEHRLAEGVGLQVWKLADAWKGNRDHKPSNLIVTTDIDEHMLPTIAIIDCAGVGGRANAGRMTEALAAECLGTGVLPRRTVLMRCVWAMADEFARQEAQEDRDPLAKRQVRRMIWRDTRLAIARHGDPTPKVNPLHPPRATDRCSERSVS